MAESITKDQLKEQQDNFVILDVREPDEFANGSIDSSQNMPLGLTIRNVKKGQIDDLKDKKICVYCASGYRGNIGCPWQYHPAGLGFFPSNFRHTAPGSC